MIQAENLTFGYGPAPVLRQLNLRIEAGQRLLLSGPSGSGKTTLFRLLCRLLRPQQGSVTVPDRLGVVFQEDRLIPGLTALENTALVSDKATARSLLEQLGLAEQLHSLPASLSGGQGRRVALARALACPSQALLLDEPFKGLDPAARRQAAQCLLARIGEKPLLVISHQQQDAALLKASPVSLSSLQKNPAQL